MGVVATPTLTLDVEPKIPADHLLYLLEWAAVVPAVDAGPATLTPDATLFELVARWYVRKLHHLLLDGLARGYREERHEVPVLRGRIQLLATTSLYYRGRTSLYAEFEEFDFDTPLNRLLLHAARLVVGSAALPPDVRRSARQAIAHMDGIGELQPADLHAEPDRQTSHYRDAALLAKQIIRSIGRTLTAGGEPVWTFLIRTPDAVESGLRALLRDALPPALRPRKRQRPVDGAAMTLNPDLVWGDAWAVGDIKYKLVAEEWRRSDLYEVTAFAAGFRVRDAVILEFGCADQLALPTVRIGDISVTQLLWPADPEMAPGDAAAQLTQRVEAWAGTRADPPEELHGRPKLVL